MRKHYGRHGTMTCTTSVCWEADTDRDPLTGRFVRQCREFEVTGEVESYTPARIRMDPDDSSPAEGGEVEITGVEEVLTVKRGRRVTESVEVEVLDELGLREDAENRLAEQAVTDDEVAKEARDDCRYDEWKDSLLDRHPHRYED